ncbi:hypothetical protein DSCO28_63550 [Desulfosarcina ovata subsp. sediminis]|uniref:Uncharacterized protein n=1 Tax=Desulfosarcina ovata subsp. sediminis TaxID=885957 RepID=A0A5K7ZZT6_9BACT|nr:hypothetical protein [Desulfosarcina ovata]BBO85789.1 hypothetical protein DSCO28_63550 [Desulfosarcina ovata subsp. sediminis]
MNVDKQFDIVLASLQSIYTNYLSNFWTALGSALIVIGWLLTSEKARNYLASDRFAKFAVLFVLFVCAVGHIRIAFLFYNASQEKMRLLGNLGNALSPVYYNNYGIMLDRLIINIVIIFVLLLLAATLVWRLKPVDKSQETTANLNGW